MNEHDFTVHGVSGFPRDIGAALWMLEDARRRTMEALQNLKDGEIDSKPAGFENSIGSLLYHIAAIEADWLFADILVVSYPEWLTEWFPFDVREEGGVLTPVTGFTVAQHVKRLAFVRNRFVEAIAGMDDEGYRRENRTPSGVVTPEWALHHLRQHEAEHRGQIQSVRTALSLASGE